MDDHHREKNFRDRENQWKWGEAAKKKKHRGGAKWFEKNLREGGYKEGVDQGGKFREMHYNPGIRGGKNAGKGVVPPRGQAPKSQGRGGEEEKHIMWLL